MRSYNSRASMRGALLGLILCWQPFSVAAQDRELLAELDAAFKQGQALKQQGKLAEAVLFWEKAAALAPKVFGADHQNTAGILNTLGRGYYDLDRFDRAEKPLKESLRIFEVNLGAEHPRVEQQMDTLAGTYSHLGRFKESEALYKRCLDSYKARGGDKDPNLTTTLNNYAAMLNRAGRPVEAEVRYRQCLEMREALYGKDTIETAYNMVHLAQMCDDLNRFEEAEDLLRRSLKIMKGREASHHFWIAAGLMSFAKIQQHQGRYTEADTLFRQALELRESKFGPDHPHVANVLSQLGTLTLYRGFIPEAEAMFRRALKIYEARVGAETPPVAGLLMKLGQLHQGLGRFKEAETFFLRSVDIYERTLGKDHPDLGASLFFLGEMYWRQGRGREAEACFVRDLRIREARVARDTTGREELEMGPTLNSLAIIAKAARQYDRAEDYYKRSLKIHDAKFGRDHAGAAVTLTNLAIMYTVMGRHKEAEQLLLDSLDRTRGSESQDYFHSHAYAALANLYHITERSRQAWEVMDSNLRLEQRKLEKIFTFSSEKSMQDYLATQNGLLPRIISMAAQGDVAADSVAMGLTWTLRLKGVMFDSLCRFRQAQHLLGSEGDVAKLAAEYRALKQRLAGAALSPPKGVSAEDFARQQGQWQQKANELEGKLNLALANNAQASGADTVSAAAVQKRLPADSCLVEFQRLPIFDFRNDTWSQPHYFAFVLSGGEGSPQLVNMGKAKILDDAVEDFRKQFTDFQEKLRECENAEEVRELEKAEEKKFLKTSAALHEKLMGPLQKHVGKAKLLYVAADGNLNRLPFETLVDANGKYLVESYRFAYLSTGRDLLRKPAAAAKGTVVFAGPDFKLDAEERQTLASKILKTPNERTEIVASRSMPAGELRSVGWKTLSGAAAEAKDIHKALDETAFGPVESFVGPRALEDVLKKIPAPRILHLATHGFFLEHDPNAAAPSDEGTGAGAVRSRLKQVDNPLLRSGVVLAGANTIGDKSDARAEDGWVTAEEIALLNLRGTELVVLSACQTGLGDARGGEGVYGLRRAFLYAGARTLLTSLFEVPDTETRELMQRFYGGLKAGSGKLASLHAAQRGMIAERRRTGGAAHPFFWGSFVLVGDPE